ncbi:uncharacterized protein BXZ73DRAFT_79004 [Epithele typhae]|uniref:uncharacterized protein n=1 Tax=Epithele typhae TaxID=378194 RepID=UPI002007C6B8|nr:uncharacterized protein BXZ73DRAFT_79004 [Epithele typhae]KAH9925691.1 hypothetical protein BXZ73DRAFT_79004 [Epithele typhae]
MAEMGMGRLQEAEGGRRRAERHCWKFFAPGSVNFARYYQELLQKDGVNAGRRQDSERASCEAWMWPSGAFARAEWSKRESSRAGIDADSAQFALIVGAILKKAIIRPLHMSNGRGKTLTQAVMMRHSAKRNLDTTIMYHGPGAARFPVRDLDFAVLHPLTHTDGPGERMLRVPRFIMSRIENATRARRDRLEARSARLTNLPIPECPATKTDTSSSGAAFNLVGVASIPDLPSRSRQPEAQGRRRARDTHGGVLAPLVAQRTRSEKVWRKFTAQILAEFVGKSSISSLSKFLRRHWTEIPDLD